MHHIAMFAVILSSVFMDFFNLAIHVGLRAAALLDPDR